MSPEKVAALRELLAKGTPGPWHVRCWLEDETDTTDEERVEHFASHQCCQIMDDAYYSGAGNHIHIYDEGGHDNADAALIVAAVNALPELLDALEQADQFCSRTPSCISTPSPQETEPRG